MSFLYIPVCAIAAVIVIKIYFKLTTGWCRSNVCLIGKTAIVTGGNAGIGYQTAADFAKRGARVILACRNPKKAEEACERMKAESHNPNVHVKLIDLGSFESVRKFADDINANEPDWDILVNNAGIAESGYHLSKDGLLLLMQTNYYSPFLLTNLLLDPVLESKQSRPRRIVNVGSIMAIFCILDVKNLEQYLWGGLLYCRSKLCNVLFTMELASRLKGTNVTTYSVHPGIIKTGLARQALSWTEEIYPFYRDQVEGAQTTIYCSVEDGIESQSGEHFQDCKRHRRYLNCRNPNLAKDLWIETEKIVKLR